MRTKIGLLILLGFLSVQLSAQSVFYGLTGGRPVNGTISKFDPSTNSLSAVFTFENTGSNPLNSEFLQGEDGKLYATTFQGGSLDKGVIFSYDLITNTYIRLQDLSDYTTGRLTKGQGNLIYGTTRSYIFSYNTFSDAYSILYTVIPSGDFLLADGMVKGADGKFYGARYSGGQCSIYSFDPITNTYSSLYTLSAAQGVVEAGMTLGADNKLYGITSSISNSGIIFSFDPVTSTFTVIHNFEFSTGEYPDFSLTLGNDSKLYGTTTSGPLDYTGAIFSYDPSTDIYTNLHVFDQLGKFSNSLVLGTDGKLYGGTNRGANEHGTIFSFDPGTNTFVNLHDFDNYNDQELPVARLFQASNGKLYGLTASEAATPGKIFSYEPGTDIFTRVYDFSLPDGIYPYGKLLVGSDNQLYGTVTEGGSNNKGVLFSFDPLTDNYTNLHDFDGIDGFRPGGNLVQMDDGKIYGASGEGGTSGGGAIFSFQPSDNSFVKLYDFQTTNGVGPHGLVRGNNGKFYGLTSGGGSNYSGVIFSFDPVTNTYTKHYDFNSGSGDYPRGNLVNGPDGKLYGLTQSSGLFSRGTIFSFNPSTNAFSKLYDFNSNAYYAFADLFLAPNGLFYGTTGGGGVNDRGIIYSFNPSTNAVVKLFDFGGLNGSYPQTALTLDNNGKLYGMTSSGGSNNLGVVFSFNIGTGVFTKLQDFNGTNGASPLFGGWVKFGNDAPPPTTKLVKVNLFGGFNAAPYNHPEWNNWHALSTSNDRTTLLTNNLKYSDGTSSYINAIINQQTAVIDNGAGYPATMAPQEVMRYASYSTSNRTLTLTGLDNSKSYDLEIYASRSGVSNNTTRFIIGSEVIDIITDNNFGNKASFTSLSPISGMITVSVEKLNTYNYINGFILTETGNGPSNPAPVVNAGNDRTIVLPVNSVQLNGSASDENGFIFSYNWEKISGPDQYNFSSTSTTNPVVSNLVQGNYTFRFTAFDNQGASSFDDINIVVNSENAAKTVKVNLHDGNAPYLDPEWNNWNTISSLSSGNLNFSHGPATLINATLSQQNAVVHNNDYFPTMAPPEVIKGASYSTSSRILTLSGLDNSKTYNLEIYASRRGVSNNTTRFTIGATSIDILTDNNLTNKASFVSLTPTGGQITINIAGLNTYNYINGFILTQNATAPPVAPDITSVRKLHEAEVKTSSTGIFPNPVKDRFVLEVNNSYKGLMKVQVVDLNGIVQKDFMISKMASGSMRTSLSIAELKQGIYFIRIQSGKLMETIKINKL